MRREDVKPGDYLQIVANLSGAIDEYGWPLKPGDEVHVIEVNEFDVACTLPGSGYCNFLTYDEVKPIFEPKDFSELPSLFHVLA